jgi:hypothetical protein
VNLWAWVTLMIGLGSISACSPPHPTPTPPPSPSAGPSPTASLAAPMGLLPTPVPGKGNAPPDVPACAGARTLDRPIRFSWTGMEDLVREAPKAYWTYYRCLLSPARLSAFYRQVAAAATVSLGRAALGGARGGDAGRLL